MTTSRTRPIGSPGRSPRSLPWLSACLTLLLVSACASFGRGSGEDLFSQERLGGPVWVEIHNDNFNDARVYARWGGQRERMGTVVGKTQAVLQTDWQPSDFRLEVDLIAAGGFVTESLVVWPRETVYLQIPPR